MFGLTTTRHLRAVEAELHRALTEAYTAKELERRRCERAMSRDRIRFRGRLDRALRAVAATRRALAISDGALRIVTERLVDQQHSTTGTTIGSSR